MLLSRCTDADLELLSNAIAQCPANHSGNTTTDDNNRKSLALAVKKLKRFMTTDAIKLIQVIMHNKFNDPFPLLKKVY